MERDSLLRISGSTVAAHSFKAEMDSEQEEIRGAIMDLFTAAFPGKESPGTKTILNLKVHGKNTRDVFYHMLNSGEIIRITDDFLATPGQIKNVVKTTRQAFPSSVAFQVPAFKDLFDISRKHAIPLLEYLDRTGVTRRSGNDRTVVEKTS